MKTTCREQLRECIAIARLLSAAAHATGSTLFIATRLERYYGDCRYTDDTWQRCAPLRGRIR